MTPFDIEGMMIGEPEPEVSGSTGASVTNAVGPGTPPWLDRSTAGRMSWFVARLLMLVSALLVFATVILVAPSASLPMVPVIQAVQTEAIAPALLTLLTPVAAGLLGTLLLSISRARADIDEICQIAPSYARRVGPSARLPQTIAVGGLAIVALGVVARYPAPYVSASSSLDFAGPIGAVAIVLTFPLLVGERFLGTTPAVVLPEAADLRALMRLAVIGWPICGLLVIGRGLGIEATRYGLDALVFLGGLVSAELAARAIARVFLPAPGDEAARAVCQSLIARSLAGALQRGGITGSVSANLGIDFSRSWALRFVIRALPPAVLALAKH